MGNFMLPGVRDLRPTPSGLSAVYDLRQNRDRIIRGFRYLFHPLSVMMIRINHSMRDLPETVEDLETLIEIQSSRTTKVRPSNL